MLQLYRTRGKHLGLHYIFDNYTEAVGLLSSELAFLNVNGQDLTSLTCFPHWTDDDIKEGDWITCDNGRVAQVVRIYDLQDKKGNKPTRCIKTAGSLGSWRMSGKTGQKYYRGCGLRIDENSLASSVQQQTMKTARSRYEICGITRKKIFVYYLVIYSSPMFAYLMTYRTMGKYAWRNNPPNRVMIRESARLLSDPFIAQELLKYNISMETFREKLSKQLEMAGMSEERIVEELSSGLDAVKKGTQTHKQFIELLMNIKRYADASEEITAEGKRISLVESIPQIQDNLPEPPRDIRQRIDIETRRVVLQQTGHMNVLPLIEKGEEKDDVSQD